MVRPLAAGTTGPGFKSSLARAYLEELVGTLASSLVGGFVWRVRLDSIPVRGIGFNRVITPSQ